MFTRHIIHSLQCGCAGSPVAILLKSEHTRAHACIRSHTSWEPAQFIIPQPLCVRAVDGLVSSGSVRLRVAADLNNLL